MTFVINCRMPSKIYIRMRRVNNLKLKKIEKRWKVSFRRRWTVLLKARLSWIQLKSVYKKMKDKLKTTHHLRTVLLWTWQQHTNLLLLVVNHWKKHKLFTKVNWMKYRVMTQLETVFRNIQLILGVRWRSERESRHYMREWSYGAEETFVE